MRLSGKFAFVTATALLFTSSLTARQNPRHPGVSWEDIPLIRTGVKIRSASSYNPTGLTYRDFDNYTMSDNGECELAVFRGNPGMLVQLWSTEMGTDYNVRTFGNLRFYLSDRPTPSFDQPRDDYFTSGEFPFLKPLCGRSHRARWGFPCIPFDNVFKAASTIEPHWYQFTCHLYREDRFSEAMTREEIETWNENLSRPPGSFPGEDCGNLIDSDRFTFQDGETVAIFERSGQGVIRAIRLNPSHFASRLMDKVIVTLYTDGEIAARVPLTVFFGGYENSSVALAQGLPCGYDRLGFYCYFPIPFWESCRVELTNTTGWNRTYGFDHEIWWSDSNPYLPETTGMFRIQYNDGIEVKKGEPDFSHLAISGSGHIVGVSANLAGSIEGNFRACIDGMKTPAIETTGGEDYFCHAFGIKVGLVTPFHGGLNEKIGYRFHIADYIPFQHSIVLGQDHGHSASHDTDGVFRSAVFYYWNPRQFLVLSDSLDVGVISSEKAHSYEIEGQRKTLRTDMASYEGNYTALFEDSGRWTDGVTSFRVSVAPDNDGVRIRKRMNQTTYHQEIRVTVDGKDAGIWFEKGSQYRVFREESLGLPPRAGYDPDWHGIDKRFRDTEFEIPASLTRDKSSITLTMTTVNSRSAIVPKDTGLTNEYYYWIYSYRKFPGD